MFKLFISVLMLTLAGLAHAQSATATSGSISGSNATAIGTQSGANAGAAINQTFQASEVKPLPGTPGFVVAQPALPTNLGGSAQAAEIVAAMAFVESCKPSYTRETKLVREKSRDAVVFFTPHQHAGEVRLRAPDVRVDEVVPGFSRKSASYVCLGQLTVKHRSGEADTAFQSLPDAAASYVLDNVMGVKKVHIVSHFDLVSLFSTMQGEARSLGGGLSAVGSLISAGLQALGIGASTSSGSSSSRTEYGVTYFVLGETTSTDPLATQISIADTLSGLRTEPTQVAQAPATQLLLGEKK